MAVIKLAEMSEGRREKKEQRLQVGPSQLLCGCFKMSYLVAKLKFSCSVAQESSIETTVG